MKIAIVEDDMSICEELEIILKNELYEVFIVKEFNSIPQQIKEENPDLILLDLGLPGIDGLQICKEIRKKSQVPIIFITGQNSSMNELMCMTMGGDDFISKPYEAPILLARIRAVLKRTSSSKEDSSILYCDGVKLNILSATIEYKDNSMDLTHNEIKILHYLFLNQGEYVSRDDLMDFLWDNSVFIDDNTLSVHVSRIRKKLKEIHAPEIIQTKRNLGYRCG